MGDFSTAPWLKQQIKHTHKCSGMYNTHSPTEQTYHNAFFISFFINIILSFHIIWYHIIQQSSSDNAFQVEVRLPMFRNYSDLSWLFNIQLVNENLLLFPKCLPARVLIWWVCYFLDKINTYINKWWQISWYW